MFPTKSSASKPDRFSSVKTAVSEKHYTDIMLISKSEIHWFFVIFVIPVRYNVAK